MATDWYRNELWTPEIEEDFFRRLGRARAYNRPQYLRIQGVHLNRAGDRDTARELWLRVVETDDAEAVGIDRYAAMEHLGDSYKEPDPVGAAQWYRRLLAEHPSLNGTTHNAELSLAEVLVTTGDVDSARASLEAWLDRDSTRTPADLLQGHLVLVDIALAEGDRATARAAARQALETADLPAPFAYHPDVGVARLDDATRKRLKRLAGRRLFRA